MIRYMNAIVFEPNYKYFFFILKKNIYGITIIKFKNSYNHFRRLKLNTLFEEC